MNIKLSDIERGITSFIDNDLMLKGNPIQQGLLTFVMLQSKGKFTKMLSSLSFFADENGEFDADTLHQNLQQALTKIGGKYTIPLINYTFDSDDLNKIFTYITGA